MKYYAIHFVTSFNGRVFFSFIDNSGTQASFDCKIICSGGSVVLSGTRIDGGQYYYSYDSSGQRYNVYIYSTSYGNVSFWDVKKELTYGSFEVIPVEDVPSGLTSFWLLGVTERIKWFKVANNDELKTFWNSVTQDLTGWALIGLVGTKLVIGFKYISSGSFLAIDFYSGGSTALKDLQPYAGVNQNTWKFA